MEPARQIAIRGYEGDEDARRIANLINTIRTAEGETSSPVDATAIKSFFESSGPDSDPHSDVHLLLSDGDLVGFVRTRRETWTDGRRVYHIMPHVQASWRGRNNLRGILEGVRNVQTRHACQDPLGAHAFLSSMQDPSDEEAIGALLDSGFKPRHFFFRMARTLKTRPEEGTLLPGLVSRPVDDAHYRSLYEFDRSMMAGAWGVEAPTEEHFAWWSAEAFLNPELWHVAWHGEKIVGTSAGVIGGTWTPGLGGKKGELRFVRIAPEWRRQGIATTLIQRSLASLWDAGVRHVILGADGEKEESAVSLYRSLGFEITSRLTAYCLDVGPSGPLQS